MSYAFIYSLGSLMADLGGAQTEIYRLQLSWD